MSLIRQAFVLRVAQQILPITVHQIWEQLAHIT
jgi:hypothetical protein